LTRQIHEWFELSYANYLVLNRTHLQSAPEDWQEKFVKLLDELAEMFDYPDVSYTVNCRKNGKFIKDPTPHYDRGRAYIKPND